MGSPPLHGMLGAFWKRQAEGNTDRKRIGIYEGKHTCGRRPAPAAPNHEALILRFYILDAVVGQQLLPVSEIA